MSHPAPTTGIDRTAVIGELAVRIDPAGHRWYKLANPGPSDDPRWVAWLPISALTVDTSVQRDLRAPTLDAIRAVGWTWSLAEALTVARRPGNIIAIVEGQHRYEVLRQQNPATRVLCILDEDIAGDAAEAATALEISRSRRPHSVFDRWEGLVVARDPHVLAGIDVMADRNLRVGHGRTAYVVSAPSAVLRILKGTVADPRPVDEGAALLGRVLDLALNIPVSASVSDKPGVRFDAAILFGIADVITKAEATGTKVDDKRLATAMTRHDSEAWLAFARPARPRWTGIAKEIRAGYNHSKRTRKV